MPRIEKSPTELQGLTQTEVNLEFREDTVDVFVRTPFLKGLDATGCNWDVVCKGDAVLRLRILQAVGRVRARYNLRAS